jgi:aspartyl/asparaginyl-tRNA synthetase
MIRSDAVRLTYREALAVLGVRGRSLAFGEALDRDAEAALVRYAGNLPVHVTHFPASLKPFDLARDDGDAETAVCVGTILPCSGETFEGGVRESSAELLASRLREDRMYRGLMQRACDLARERAAGGGATDAASGDAEALGARYQRTIETAFARYLGRFAGGEVRRAGFGLEIARLLQYFMGVDSVKQAVVFPLDRTSLGSGG